MLIDRFIPDVAYLNNSDTTATICIQITKKCNWNCNYCIANTRASDYKKEDSRVTQDHLNKLIKLMSELKNKDIALSGGEPGLLSYQNIKRIFSDINSSNMISLNTNGTFFKHLINIKDDDDFNKENSVLRFNLENCTFRWHLFEESMWTPSLKNRLSKKDKDQLGFIDLELDDVSLKKSIKEVSPFIYTSSNDQHTCLSYMINSGDYIDILTKLELLNEYKFNTEDYENTLIIEPQILITEKFLQEIGLIEPEMEDNNYKNEYIQKLTFLKDFVEMFFKLGYPIMFTPDINIKSNNYVALLKFWKFIKSFTSMINYDETYASFDDVLKFSQKRQMIFL